MEILFLDDHRRFNINPYDGFYLLHKNLTFVMLRLDIQSGSSDVEAKAQSTKNKIVRGCHKSFWRLFKEGGYI